MLRLSRERLRDLVMNGSANTAVYAAAHFHPSELVEAAFDTAIAEGYARQAARELTITALAGVLPESVVRNALPL